MGRTELHYACAVGDLAKVMQGVESRNLNVNEADKHGLGPLHVASRYGHAHIVSYLLQQGADRNMRDSTGATAMDNAKNAETREAFGGGSSFGGMPQGGIGGMGGIPQSGMGMGGPAYGDFSGRGGQGMPMGGGGYGGHQGGYGGGMQGGYGGAGGAPQQHGGFVQGNNGYVEL